ncbi:hypothetical protein NRF20_45925 [Streptomyces sp. R-74717]|uniref:hypothetical protein n=1 Tax=Streptomyces sp. R-74717 TaxID=2969820 RepID=UPI0039B52FB4
MKIDAQHIDEPDLVVRRRQGNRPRRHGRTGAAVGHLRHHPRTTALARTARS